ncbi:hypothetical protein ATC03_08510 [Agromyces aureus]|uniref:M23ase beta-sheet core domain-containing protein n=1 Tax=Agromyces aureus TaxID=453304 RepID=A0A191WKR5_9MICO|nr:hypothetical protein ATC03_08510 [Agromyces aureus]
MDRLRRSSKSGIRIATAVAFAVTIPISLGAPASADGLVVHDHWIWPASPPIRVVAPFRAPPTPYAAGHRGIDLRASAGEPALAPADGVVSFVGMVAGRPVVSIDHGAGLVSSLEPVVATAIEGASVAAGAELGAVGSGGHCDDRCVHLGVRLHGEYVSPLLYLGGVPWAVLLPS